MEYLRAAGYGENTGYPIRGHGTWLNCVILHGKHEFVSDRILVTGGSGFIGSALTRRLVQDGNQVIVLDNNSRGNLGRLQDVIDAVTFIESDIRDATAVSKAVAGCDAVFHLAFVNGTKHFYEKPEQVLDIGLKGALTTIEAALDHQVSTYVMASSSEVYQQPTQIPTPESERAIIPDVRNPRFSYAGGKLISELLTQNYFRKSSVRDMIFRPHNVFGPNMGLEHVIPELMQKLYHASAGWTRKEIELEIQGNGAETRAFCYVEDAVDQLMIMYKNGGKGDIYHIGIDREQSILELISKLAELLDISVTVVPGTLRAGGTSRRCPDITKIRQLGYDNTDRFEEGLARTVVWYRETLSDQTVPRITH